MAQKSAAPRPNLIHKRLPQEEEVLLRRTNGSAIRPGPGDELELTPVQRAAVACFAQGWSRDKIAIKLRRHIAPELKGQVARQHMRTKVVLRSWERQEWFRDAVWDWTVEWIDLQTPQIARAVAAQAKRGKINEAKFLLELSGRYSPKGDNAVAAVQVVVQGIPRPEDTVVEALPPQDLDAVAEALRPSRPQAEG